MIVMLSDCAPKSHANAKMTNTVSVLRDNISRNDRTIPMRSSVATALGEPTRCCRRVRICVCVRVGRSQIALVAIEPSANSIDQATTDQGGGGGRGEGRGGSRKVAERFQCQDETKRE